MESSMEDIILVGFGGHARSIVDCIERGRKYRIAGFTDIGLVKEYRGYPCLGGDDVLAQYFEQGVRNAFIAVGYLGEGAVRDRLYKTLKEIGYRLPVITDDSAVIAADATLGEGTFVGKCAVVNAAASVGRMCIVNTGAIVEHEDRIGDFTHISVGTVLCGNVTVGDHCFVGANATVIQGITVGNCCVVGAGSLVHRDVPKNSRVVGARILTGHSSTSSYILEI